MARNVEIKARLSPTEFENIQATAEKLGRGPELLMQTDTFFHVHDGRLKLREFADGSAELISYSRSDEAEPRLCRYERFAVDDPAGVKSMLEKSTGIQCVVEKKRTLYLIDQTRIHLDEVNDLGLFLEIEVVLRDDQMEEIGQEIMESLLNQFGIDSSHFESLAYADMILAKMP